MFVVSMKIKKRRRVLVYFHFADKNSIPYIVLHAVRREITNYRRKLINVIISQKLPSDGFQYLNIKRSSFNFFDSRTLTRFTLECFVLLFLLYFFNTVNLVSQILIFCCLNYICIDFIYVRNAWIIVLIMGLQNYTPCWLNASTNIWMHSSMRFLREQSLDYCSLCDAPKQ